MRPIRISRTLAAADPNGIALDQTTGGAGDLTLNGAFVVDGVAQLDVQRQVSLESVGNLSGINFTIVGTDEQSRPISETISGPNVGVVATTLDFFTVTRVSVDAAVGTNVEVGTNETGGSVVIPLDQYISPFNVSLGAIITGTVNATVQFTFDDVFSGVGPFSWTNQSDLTNIVASADGTFISPVSACRILTNSGNGTITLIVLQAGLS